MSHHTTIAGILSHEQSRLCISTLSMMYTLKVRDVREAPSSQQRALREKFLTRAARRLWNCGRPGGCGTVGNDCVLKMPSS